MKSYLFLLCALLAVAAEPVKTFTDDEAFAALQGITANQPVKDQALYCRALGLFHNALSNPRNKLAQRPEFAAILDKVKASPAIAVGPGKPLLHFKQNQMGALRILLDASTHPERLRADHLTKHPSADLYPGAVPANAPRLTESVFLNTRAVGWVSTGLYAPAGEKITLTIPADLVNKGAKVRIGANTAELYAWSEASRSLGRFPKIDGEMPLTQTVTEFGNSFGGPIYIDLPDNGQGIDRGKADINGLVGTYSYPEAQIAKFTFAGVVKMPYFLPGLTSVEEWRTTIRNYHAPVAELATYKIIFTLPAQYIRTLDDPTVPLAVWDKIQNANTELCGRPFTRPMPMRIAIDAQVKWGEAYATYPICAPFYWTPPIVEGKPGWGHCHEIGHLHQKPDWTFQGCGEVTVKPLLHVRPRKSHGRHRPPAARHQRPAPDREIPQAHPRRTRLDQERRRLVQARLLRRTRRRLRLGTDEENAPRIPRQTLSRHRHRTRRRIHPPVLQAHRQEPRAVQRVLGRPIFTVHRRAAQRPPRLVPRQHPGKRAEETIATSFVGNVLAF